MPELPEVETVRRGLSELLPGRVVADVSYDTDKSFPNAPADVQAFLIGATVRSVKRRAKVLMIELANDYSLVIHLKMTGQLVFVSSDTRFGAGHPNDSLVQALPDRSTRVTFSFVDGSQLFFNDQRKFGWVRLMPTTEVMNIDFMRRVGPEPLAAEFTTEQFALRLQRRKNTSIKAALLDQSVIAGVGNIYADESLWGGQNSSCQPGPRCAEPAAGHIIYRTAVCAEPGYPARRLVEPQLRERGGQKRQLHALCPGIPARGFSLSALWHDHRETACRRPGDAHLPALPAATTSRAAVAHRLRHSAGSGRPTDRNRP